MQIRLEGKVAIITGVSGDGQVGQAVAKALAENGAQLAICAPSKATLKPGPKSCETQAPVCSLWWGL
jgi:NAD(P)-dependent dehydrogenase (short-subunit alcohol dehydrogenase family)